MNAANINRDGRTATPSNLDNIEARTEWRPSPDADADEVAGVLADRHHPRGHRHAPALYRVSLN